MTAEPTDDVAVFESQRARLRALAYRMLGDYARAEDVVQEAWLRWQRRGEADVESPGAYLATIVTRLCLTELDSARARREESRGDRLPEPIHVGDDLAVETAERISMAFVVMLQRLTPAERAVLLLHDVFDLEHAEIAGHVGKTPAACRKLLERAHEAVTAEKRMLSAPREAHERLLGAFVTAVGSGDVEGLVALLADDAVMVTDGGPDGTALGGARNLATPLRGGRKIATFTVRASKAGGAALAIERATLNAQPAVVFRANGIAVAALLLGVADDRIHRVWFCADAARLGHLESARSG